jgi:hypothetical protein
MTLESSGESGGPTGFPPVVRGSAALPLASQSDATGIGPSAATLGARPWRTSCDLELKSPASRPERQRHALSAGTRSALTSRARPDVYLSPYRGPTSERQGDSHRSPGLGACLGGDRCSDGGAFRWRSGVRRPPRLGQFPRARRVQRRDWSLLRRQRDRGTRAELFHTLAALALLGFSAYVPTALRRDDRERSGLPALAFAGGVAAPSSSYCPRCSIACSPSPRSRRTPLSPMPCWWRPTSRAVPPSRFPWRS